MLRVSYAICLCALLGACATVRRASGPAEPPPAPVPEPGLGAKLVAHAERLVGLPSLRRVEHQTTDDCSGMVSWVFSREGIDLLSEGTLPRENAVAAIYRRARKRGALRLEDPRPGDLVFFRETYDQNRDGVRNDGMTHIGIVESVDPAGTVTFIHRAGTGVTRSRLNVRFPGTTRADSGALLNDYLRRPERGRRPALTGELFSGYASPEPLR